MTMHTVFFKEHVQNSGNIGQLSAAVPPWSGLGSQMPAVAAYGGGSIGQLNAAPNKESRNQEADQLGNGNTTHHFTLFSGCAAVENGEKTVSSVDYRGPFELGFGQPLICAKYPYPEEYYGLYSTYGTQIAGRIMLPLSMATDGGPIFVNAKQHSGILRRRKKRAAAELENKVIRGRKPYLHLSRHLHALRRARGNGGRFLNTKNSNAGPQKTSSPKKSSTGPQIFEVMQPNGGIDSNETRSTSPGSEVTSDHLFSSATSVHPFQFNHLHPSFQPFPDHAANTGLNDYLKI